MVKLIFRGRVPLGTKDIEIAQALRDLLLDATPKIGSSVPRVRGQAMPGFGPEVCEGRAVLRDHPGAAGVSLQPFRAFEALRFGGAPRLDVWAGGSCFRAMTHRLLATSRAAWDDASHEILLTGARTLEDPARYPVF